MFPFCAQYFCPTRVAPRLSKGSPQFDRQFFGLTRFALPYDMDGPAESLERSGVLTVPRFVCGDFRTPVIQATHGKAPFGAFVSMPITAMDEQDGFAAGKHNVGRTRQVSPVQPVSITEPGQQPSNKQLRPRIFGADGLHYHAPLSASPGVHNYTESIPKRIRQ
jgi:hypothetical protein